MDEVELVTPYFSLLDKGGPKYPFQSAAVFEKVVQRLNSYRYDRLNSDDQFYYDLLSDWYKSVQNLTPYEAYVFPLNHVDGIWTSFLYMMDVIQPVRSESEASAYISRMKRWKGKMQETISYMQAHDFPQNIPAPYLIDSAINQFTYYLQLPTDQHPLYKAFARKSVQNDPTKFNPETAATMLRQVEETIENDINPALKDAISFLSDSSYDAAITPDSLNTYPAYHMACLRLYTSLTLDPDSLIVDALAWKDTLTNSVQLQRTLAEKTEPFVSSVASDSYTTDKHNRVDATNLSEWVDSLSQNVRNVSTGIFQMVPQSTLIVRYLNLPYVTLAPFHYEYLLNQATGKGILLTPYEVEHVSKWELPVKAYYYGIPGKHSLASGVWEQPQTHYCRAFLHYPSFENGWALYAATTLEASLQLHYLDTAIEVGFQREKYRYLLKHLADLYIHQKGKSRKETAALLIESGQFEPWEVEGVIDEIILRPGIHSATWLGYRQLIMLREMASQELGNNFILQDFHNFIIQTGPCPFEMLYRLWSAEFLAEEIK